MSAFKAALSVLVVSSAAHASAAVYVWATDKACPALKPAIAEIGRVPFPGGWTVVVACNETQWELLQRKADAQQTKNAFTNLKGRVTVVHGAMFLRLTVGRPVHRVCSTVEALKWFEKAAAGGLVQAQFVAALLYETGDGVPENFGKALELYRRAAQNGYGPAQDNLGCMHEKGEGDGGRNET